LKEDDMERSVTHIALFAALIAVLGLVPQITLAVGVPITAQSLGIMLCGTVLGARRGALAVGLFLVLVAAGLPLLSGGRGGLGVFAGPSAGFLAGFPVAAFVCGLTVERWRMAIGPAALVGAVTGGIAVLYAFGIPVMAARLTEAQIAGMPLNPTLSLPLALAALYLPGDLIKAVLAALITRGVARARPGSLLSRPAAG
jgi:biotin transport system substrate-specific component